MISGDQARASVTVAVPIEEAFRIFTEEIDQWWRRGLKYRVSGKRRGIMHLEPRAGGRLFEDIAGKIVQTGTVLVCDPPTRLLIEWRNVNFKPHEKTEVEVVFEAMHDKTMVTVTHRGWSTIRPDHPARHGQEVVTFVRNTALWWGELLSSLREFSTPDRGSK